MRVKKLLSLSVVSLPIGITTRTLSGSQDRNGNEGYAVQNGLKEEELIEVITHLAFYSGWPNTMSAIMAAKEAFSKA